MKEGLSETLLETGVYIKVVNVSWKGELVDVVFVTFSG